MWLILVLGLIMLVGHIGKLANEAGRKTTLTEIGLCPPHKWYYDEIKDQEGKIVRWRMVCHRCGPLRPLDQPDRNI